jgi:hypothetical protein
VKATENNPSGCSSSHEGVIVDIRPSLSGKVGSVSNASRPNSERILATSIGFSWCGIEVALESAAVLSLIAALLHWS